MGQAEEGAPMGGEPESQIQMSPVLYSTVRYLDTEVAPLDELTHSPHNVIFWVSAEMQISIALLNN